MTNATKDIINIIKGHGGTIHVNQLAKSKAKEWDSPYHSAAQRLTRLVKKGYAERVVRGTYRLK